MTKLKDFRVGYGDVTFRRAVENRPEETVFHDNNLTFTNAARAGSPSYYDVSIPFNFSVEEGGVETSNYLTLSVAVLESDQKATYRSIDDRAIRQLAPLLREVADRIEADIERVENERKSASTPD